MVKVQISLRLESELLNAIDALAGQKSVTRTEVIEYLLNGAIQNQGWVYRSVEQEVNRMCEALDQKMTALLKRDEKTRDVIELILENQKALYQQSSKPRTKGFG